MRQIHVVIAPGSADWWIMNLSFLICGVLLYRSSKHDRWSLRQEGIAKFITFVLICNVVTHHIYFFSLGDWSLKHNLPLQLCAMSELIAISMLLTRSQFLYELLLCWSAGAIHAFITPELTHGYGALENTAYVVSHGGVILTALFANWSLGFTPRKHSWLKIFLFTQLTLPVIGGVNYLTGANYMFLSEPPAAKNPMIIGKWPWYIVSLELVVLVHFFLFYQIHLWVARVRDRSMAKTEDLGLGAGE